MLLDLSCDDLSGLHVWFVPPTIVSGPTVIESARRGPKGMLIKFAGIDSVEHASTLRDVTITASMADLPQGAIVKQFDPIGMSVFDETRGEIGVISEVIVTGANDVWVVDHGPWGQVLIPVIDDVVLNVDKVRARIYVRLLDGLIDRKE